MCHLLNNVSDLLRVISFLFFLQPKSNPFFNVLNPFFTGLLWVLYVFLC